MSEFVVPGDLLGRTSEGCAPAEGTYEFNGRIIASTLGLVHKERIKDEKGNPTVEVSVCRSKEAAISPKPGDIVVCRALKIMQRQLVADILVVNGVTVEGSFSGIVRIQDVRETETITLKMVDCYRPGDIVVAEVISLGDARHFFLSTAKNEYGVIFARSALGEKLVPVSWQEMEGMSSKRREKRKVAKYDRNTLKKREGRRISTIEG